jgi:hypothetical protein
VADRGMLARVATRAALQARRSLSIPRDQPINPFDIAESLGIEVRFVDAPSLEGMFSRAPHPLILLPSLGHRPRGRLAFTCAHELGHGLLDHGERVDDLVAEPLSRHDPAEFSADVFAGALLMPRPAVTAAFARRHIDVATASHHELFRVSCDLGVGFSTLIHHITFGLQMTGPDWAQKHARITAQSIRQSLLGPVSAPSVLHVDEHYSAPTVDLSVGEVLVTEAPAITTSDRLLHEESNELATHRLYRAARPGESSVHIGGRLVSLRVCRTNYVGPHRNRFLEDPEAE